MKGRSSLETPPFLVGVYAQGEGAEAHVIMRIRLEVIYAGTQTKLSLGQRDFESQPLAMIEGLKQQYY